MDASTATEVAAGIAFCGVLISASVAYVTASRSVYVNAVTSARIRWLEKVRDLIVEFREDHLRICIDKRSGVSIAKDDIYKLKKNYQTICLSLGRSKNEDNILVLSTHCLATLNEYDDSVKYSHVMQLHTRWLLEIEWKRIKLESSNLLSYPFKKSELSRKELDYYWFASRDGAFEDRAIEMDSLVKPSLSSPASAEHP